MRKKIELKKLTAENTRRLSIERKNAKLADRLAALIKRKSLIDEALGRRVENMIVSAKLRTSAIDQKIKALDGQNMAAPEAKKSAYLMALEQQMETLEQELKKATDEYRTADSAAMLP